MSLGLAPAEPTIVKPLFSLLPCTSHLAPGPRPIQQPKWTVVPLDLCLQGHKPLLRIASVMGKGSSHVKCDSQWCACLGAARHSRAPFTMLPGSVTHQESSASLGNYASQVEAPSTATEGPLLRGLREGRWCAHACAHTHRLCLHNPPSPAAGNSFHAGFFWVSD